MQSALAAPFAGFGDVELFPTLEAKAAIYCARLVAYHPLPDGNKRTAYDVMIEFVKRNGRTWTHPAGGLDETASMIERLAGEPPPPTEEQFCAWAQVASPERRTSRLAAVLARSFKPQSVLPDESGSAARRMSAYTCPCGFTSPARVRGCLAA